MKLLKVLVRNRKKSNLNFVCLFTNPISICNKFKNLGGNSDSYCQVNRINENIFRMEKWGEFATWWFSKTFLLVKVVFLFKIRFS